MLSLRDYVEVVRHLGAGWLARRAVYAARRRLGGLERAMPRRAWHEVNASELVLEMMPADRGPGRPVDASGIGRGEFTLFSHQRVDVGGPPDWHRNQLTGQTLPADVHWSRIGDFSHGDIKGVWELSRFGWAYALVRDGRGAAAETFWRWWADWMRHNPPNLGPNWMCGQEASIRLMAVVFAAERFGVPRERRDALSRFVVATGERIAANLDYALGQQNNHGISECVGLLTAALLVPGYPPARGWRCRALEQLRVQVQELVYADGAFSQHSVVYHRVALHQLCWAASRLRVARQEMPDWLVDAGRRATDFLAAITDPATGEAPLFGANDGAELLPLAACDFLDFRPAVQLGSAMFEGKLRYAPGPWDEAVAWLARDASRAQGAPGPLNDFHAPQGGVLQIVAGRDRLVMRCPTRFRHRPSQADFGHVDVWLAGARVAIDGGSFSYNSGERFVQLGDLREHNSVSIAGLAPMRQVTRFLQLPWPTGEIQETQPGVWRYWPHLYPAAGVSWQRTVARRKGGGFRVSDVITGTAGRKLRWHWRLVDAEWSAGADDSVRATLESGIVEISWRANAPLQRQMLRADVATAAGWQSRRYGAVEPAVSLVLTTPGVTRVEVIFEFCNLSR